MFSVKKLDKLVAEGIISAKQKEQILNFEKDKKAGFVGKLLQMLGVFICGVGIISVVAANWDFISDGVKLFVAFALLFSGALLTFYWQQKGEIGKSESMLVGLFLMIGATIGLIIQVYQLSGGQWYSVFGVWCLVSAPMLFVAKRKYLAYFWTPVFLFFVNFNFNLISDWELVNVVVFAVFAFLGKMMVLYVPKFTLGEVLRKYSLFVAYLCFALYIIFAWRLAYLYRLFIAIGILVGSSFIYKHYGAYHLIRRNIKFGGLVVFMFYVNIAGEIGLFQSGIGLIISGIGLICLVKYLPKIAKLFAVEKKDA